MEIIATQKYLLLSPKKIRPVANLAKKMKPMDAINRLPFVGKKAGEPLIKVIKSALASARSKGLNETDLVFKEIQIGEGPRLKRGRPVSRGQWHPIKKRMSHIRVVLQTAPSKKMAKAEEVKLSEEKKVEKVKKVKGEKTSA